MKYALSSQLAEFLLAFEETGSTERLAGSMQCSLSVVFRNLQALSDLGAFVTKIEGRWSITELGRQLNVVSRQTIAAQKRLMRRPYAPVIGYSAALLSDISIGQLYGTLLNNRCTPRSFESCDPSEAEERLSRGELDFVFSNRIPASPLFRCHVLRTFLLMPVISTAWGDDGAAEAKPPPFVYSKHLSMPLNIAPKYSDPRSRILVENVSACLEYVRNGFGWSLIPDYLINESLRDGTMMPLLEAHHPEEHRLVVFWLREKEGTAQLTRELAGCFETPLAGSSTELTFERPGHL